MKEKSKSEVSIIGGADGPTSIFIAGRTRKKPLKVRIRKKKEVAHHGEEPENA